MKNVLLAISLCVVLMVIAVRLPAQSPPKEPASGAFMNKGQKVTVHGKVEYMKSLGGYFVKAENPSQEMIIVNPNPKVLEQFYRSGKRVTVEGHLTIGAEHLFIERIDGMQYRGAKKATPK